MMIEKANLTLNVREMNRSVAFYESIGFSLINRWEDHYAQMEVPGLMIGLHPAREENLRPDSGNASLGFTARDFNSAKAMLEKLSIPFTEREEEGGSFLHFSDPDGTALYFIRPRW